MTNYKITSLETTPDKLNENLDYLQGEGYKIYQIIPYASNLYGNTWDRETESNSDFQTTIKLIVLYFVEVKGEEDIDSEYGGIRH